MATILLILFSAILIMLIVMTYRIRSMGQGRQQASDVPPDAEKSEHVTSIQNWIYAAIVFMIIAIISSFYFMVKETPYQAHLMEWLNIIVRVMHVTFGIAWIGASFYFVFLENALNRNEGIRDELAGNLWAIHGGGFYYLEKYKGAPKEIPRHLHWFKYEAYFTWISGFGLLFIIYYFNASSMMIDPGVMELSAARAILISVLSFIIAWVIYDLLCKSPIAKRPWVFVPLGLIFLVAFAYFYTRVYSGRAAFIHFGAMLGTLMAANVFFVIIPSQKSMVNAARKGPAPDLQKGKKALFRSIHNNYLTLPVLFVMVSNHFPSTFGSQYHWIVLALITLGAAGIKHWLNLREQGRLSVWILPVSIVVLLVAAYVTAPQVSTGKCREVDMAEINSIIQQRCASCHSSRPTDDTYKIAPNGVKYDTPLEIIAKKDAILQRVVITKTMPLNNKTSMTPEEREVVRCWIENTR
jgi:uncharacterized membrane protein